MDKTLTFLQIASSAIKDAMTEAYEWGYCPQEREQEMAGGSPESAIDTFYWETKSGHARN